VSARFQLVAPPLSPEEFGSCIDCREPLNHLLAIVKLPAVDVDPADPVSAGEGRASSPAIRILFAADVSHPLRVPQ